MSAINKEELENIIQGFTVVNEVLKNGMYPGWISDKLISAIKFIEALERNQKDVLDKFTADNLDTTEKELKIN